MKVILYMTVTANSIIARETGEEDFFSGAGWHSFKQLSEQHGCFITGRGTYETCEKYYKNYSLEDVKATRIIVSRKKNFKKNGFETARNPLDALKKARAMGLKSVVLCGGSINNSAFMKQGLIDKIILDIEPVIVGKGKTLFTEGTFENKLRFVCSRKLENGIIRLQYDVVR
jgi:dihydrofolate reductase